MKKIAIIACAAVLTAGTLTGCDNKEQTGTLIGIAAGGLIGSQFGGGDGKIIGLLAGSALGGFIGNRIGAQMDRQDQANMRRAIIDTPVNHQAQWTNERTHTTYTVTPVRQYHTKKHRYCREYQTKVTIGGKQRDAYGKACRKPDGSWHIVK